jgi:hypothetical protein
MNHHVDYTKPVKMQEHAPLLGEYDIGQRVAVIKDGLFWGNYVKCRNSIGEPMWMGADRYWDIF